MLTGKWMDEGTDNDESDHKIYPEARSGELKWIMTIVYLFTAGSLI